jgi:hypothetical protein
MTGRRCYETSLFCLLSWFLWLSLKVLLYCDSLLKRWPPWQKHNMTYIDLKFEEHSGICPLVLSLHPQFFCAKYVCQRFLEFF